MPKFSGHADFQLNQALNMKIEMLASLPTFVPEFDGRVINVFTLGPEFGLYIGTSTGWLRIGESLAYLISTYDFAFYSLDTTNPVAKPVRERTGTTDFIPMPMEGNIIMVEVFGDVPITQNPGITVKPVINGSPSSSSDLDVDLNTTHPLYNQRSVAPDHVDFDLNVADTIALQVTGGVGTLPALINMRATMHVMLPFVLAPLQQYDTFEFMYWGLGPGVSAPAVPPYIGFPGLYVTKPGHLISHTVIVDPARGAGSVSFIPTINGTPVGDPGLNLLIDGINPRSHFKTKVVDPAFAVSAGDYIGVDVASDGFLAPNLNCLSYFTFLYTP